MTDLQITAAPARCWEEAQRLENRKKTAEMFPKRSGVRCAKGSWDITLKTATACYVSRFCDC